MMKAQKQFQQQTGAFFVQFKQESLINVRLTGACHWPGLESLASKQHIEGEVGGNLTRCATVVLNMLQESLSTLDVEVEVPPARVNVCCNGLM